MPTTEMFLPLLTPFIYMTILMVILIGIKVLIMNIKYSNSSYGNVSGNNFLKTILDKGNYGEFLTFKMLEKLDGDNKILTNVYIPKEDGTTTEIDLLMINKSGIYVFESKNYSGWIFGDEKNKNWTQSFKGGKKNKFLNPIWQNKAHINALLKLINVNHSKLCCSYIIFSERCELKKITVSDNSISVVKRNGLLRKLRNEMNSRADNLSEVKAQQYFSLLKKHSLASDEVKQKHIDAIKSKYN